MRKYSILWASLAALVLGGCGTKHYTHSEPKMITLKTPKLKFSDAGYIRHDGENVEVELFAAGVAVEKISMEGKKVCVSSGCMAEEKFVQEYLYPDYPADTMRSVVLGKDIFGGKGKEEMCDGRLFQFIRNDEMDIIYRRGKGEIYFKDRLNSLIIKITDLGENNATE